AAGAGGVLCRGRRGRRTGQGGAGGVGVSAEVNPCRIPPPGLPLIGGGTDRGWGANVARSTARLLPLSGGGWEGVSPYVFVFVFVFVFFALGAGKSAAVTRTSPASQSASS